jgi:hypothetical protein
MSNDTGYAGWKYVEMDDEEKASVTSIAKIIDAVVEKAGYDSSVRNNLSVTFKKAVLTIDKDAASSGAWHSLADGKPFYRMEIAAGDKTIFDADKDQTAALVFYLMQSLGGGSMSMGGPLVLKHDFRGDMVEKGLMVAAHIGGLKSYVVKPAGPKLN